MSQQALPCVEQLVYKVRLWKTRLCLATHALALLACRISPTECNLNMYVSVQTAAAELADTIISGFEAYCKEESDMSDPSTMPCTLGLYDLTSLDQLTGPIIKLAASLTQAFTSLEVRDAKTLAGEWCRLQAWPHCMWPY